jgi:2-polyprenyl-6-hydroxyphenyl methylase/3-demethylubiquinone-9 3-methyltransferase
MTLMETAGDVSGYSYKDPDLSASHESLVPALLEELMTLRLIPACKCLFELGCENGSVAEVLTQQGYRVTGIEPPAQGIGQANRHYTSLNLRLGAPPAR